MSNDSQRRRSTDLMEHNGVTPKYYGRCPKCASKELQRSRRKNVFERLISYVVLPWRCNICYTRFFRPFWFKAEPRQLDVGRQFQNKSSKVVQSAAPARSGLFGMSEKALPGFIKRNPALAFLIPARSHVRHVKDAMPLGTK
jgi:hypothetical protein